MRAWWPILSVGVVFVGFVLSGCGPRAAQPVNGDAAAAAQRDAAKRSLSSGSAVERFFPLVHGNVYHYATEDTAGKAGVMIVRAQRTDASRGELHVPGGVKSFEYHPDGVVLHKPNSMNVKPSYVLKLPLDVGTRWHGEHRGWVEILKTDTVMQVGAGSYSGCINTVEQRGGDRPLRIATTFCPEVGMVLIELASGDKNERIELQSYGPPVDLGPDGVKVIK